MPGGQKRWTRAVPGGLPCVIPFNPARGNRRFTYTGTDVNVSQLLSSSSTAATPMGSVVDNGTTSYISEGSDAYQLDFGAGNFTIDLYVKLNGLGGKCLFQMGITALSVTAGYGLQAVSNIVNFSTANNVLSQLVWAHVAWTRSGNVQRLFVNGVQVGTQTDSRSVTTAYGLLLGTDGTTFFAGELGWTRVVKGKALWTAAFTPPRRHVPPPRPAGCAIWYDWTLDTVGSAISQMVPGGSGVLTGAPGIQARTWEGNASYSWAQDYAANPYFFINGASLRWNDSGTQLSFGSADFTVDVWIREYVDDVYTKYGASGGRCWICRIGANDVTFIYSSDGTNTTTVTKTTPVANDDGAWHHIAWVRTGNVLRMFQDGVQCGTDAAITVSIINTASYNVYIGGNYYNVAYLRLSYFRVTLGAALWTGTSFTVPTEASYAVTANTKVLIPGDQDFGYMQSGTYIFDKASPARVWSIYTGTAVTLYNNPYSKMVITSQDFTIECWVSLVSGYGQYLVSQQESTVTVGWALKVQAAAYRLAFLYAPFPGTTVTVDSTVTLSTGRWYHVAISRVGSSLLFVIDGQVETFSIGSVVLRRTEAPLVIGARFMGWYNHANYFQGKIAGLRITIGQALYAGTFAPPTKMLRKNSAVVFVDDEEQLGHIEASYYAQTASTTPFNLEYGNYTLDAWVFSEWNSANQYVTEICSRSNDYSFKVTKDGALLCGLGDAVYSVNGAVPLCKWTHVAFVRSGMGAGGGKLYINGVEPAYAAQPTPWQSLSSTQPFTVGSTSAAYHYGRMMNVRFTAAARWTAPFTPPTSAADYAEMSNVKFFLRGNRVEVGAGYRAVDHGPDSMNFTAAFGGVLDEYKGRPVMGGTVGRNTGGTLQRRMERPAGVTSVGGTTRYHRMYRALGGMGYAVAFQSSARAACVQTAFDFTKFKVIYAANSGGRYCLASDPFTLHMWFRYSGTAYPKYLLSVGPDTVYSYRLWIINATGLRWSILDGSGIAHIIDASRVGVTLNDGNWHHVAIVRSATATTVYIDGVSGGSDATSYAYRAVTGSLYIGEITEGTPSGYGLTLGAIACVEILKGAALWTTSFTPPTDRRDFVHSQSLVSLSPEFSSGTTQVMPYDRIRLFEFSHSTLSTPGWIATPVTGTVFGTEDFTIDFWVRGPTTGSEFDLFANSYNWPLSSTETYGAVRIYTNTSGNFCFSVYNGSVQYVVTSYTARTANVWQHVALVRVGTTITLYIDGVSVGSQVVAANYSLANHKALGWSCYGTTGETTGGYADQLRIFVGKALWTAAFTPPTTVDQYRRAYTTQCQHWVHGTRKSSPGGQYAVDIEANGSMSQPWWVAAFGVLVVPQTATRMPLSLGAGDFTIEFWITLTGAPGSGVYGLVVGGSALMGGNNYGFQIVQTTGNIIQAMLYNTSRTLAATVNSSYVAGSQWTHIAVVRSGSSLKMFKNGYLCESVTTTVLVGASAITPTFFNDASSGSCSFAGAMSNFQCHVGVAKYKRNFIPDPCDAPMPNQMARY